MTWAIVVYLVVVGIVAGAFFGSAMTYSWAVRTVDGAVATSMARANPSATPTPHCQDWVVGAGCVTIEWQRERPVLGWLTLTPEWMKVGPILGWITLTPAPPTWEPTCYDVFEPRDWPDYCLPVSIATDLARLRILDAKATAESLLNCLTPRGNHGP